MSATLQIPEPFPREFTVRIVLNNGAADTPIAGGKQGYCAPGARFETVVCNEERGVEVALRLHAEPDCTVAAFGIELGPLDLKEHDKFFCEIPGFLEKSGAMPALAAQSERQESILFGLVARPGRASCLLGLGTLANDAVTFSLRGDRLRAELHPHARPADGITELRLFLTWDVDPLECLRRYGGHLAQFGRPAHAPTPSGWNSWDFYGGAIRMADIDREMAALDHLACRDQLQYLTLDMGWEEAWGNWIPNRGFPATFQTLAARIRRGGWKPGIWTAPLQVNMFTALARQRQDLFLRDEEGSLIILHDDMPDGPALLLDVTLPEVRDLVAGWYRAMRQAGFELFKIDYLYNRFLSLATHCATGVGKVAFARTLLQTIRDAVGDEAHILNCGGNKEAAIGIADSSRVSMDIHNFWGHIRNNARQIAGCFWMNRNLWVNDPDFAIVRTAENCAARYRNMPYTRRPLTDDGTFWMRGPEASRDELRAWLAVTRLNGGSLFLSDSIASLSSDGRKELDRIVPTLDAPFDPLDLFERRHPAIWLSRDTARPTLGLFNWEDTEQTLDLPPPLNGPLAGKEFWTGKQHTFAGEARLPPRSVLLLDL